tara:strand:- start:106 stop:534 length:429 start_codon:yes stop_codon:yes gene_type:complete
MKNIFLMFILIFGGCEITSFQSERQVLVQKLEAFQLLSTYHHQLHIMIGEDEGDADVAFNEFGVALRTKKQNPELIPIFNAFNRIKNFEIASPDVMKLDYLVDYYQSGLALSIEGIMRGYGILKALPLDSVLIIYDDLLINN